MSHHSISLGNYAGTLYRYRDLITNLVAREFKSRFRGSMLGVLWAVLNPLLTVLVFTFVFSVVFQARWVGQTADADFTLIVLTGMTIHGIFAETLGRAPTLILSNASYVKKVVFPLEILPAVVLSSAIISAGIGMAVVIVANVLINWQVSATLLYLPVVLAPYLLVVMGITLFVSAIGVYLRDLSQIVSLLITVTMFMAPIFYPISGVPESYRTFLYLNPMTFTVEQARAVTLFGASPDWGGLLIYTVAGFAVLFAGLYWFQKTRNGFADVI